MARTESHTELETRSLRRTILIDITVRSQQVTDFFVKAGNIQNPVPASTYFDPKLYLDTIKG